MDIYVYSEELEVIGICDTFTSLIWVRRFSSAGSFELYAPATAENLRLFLPYRFLYRPDTDEAMYIRSIQGQDGERMIVVSGFSLDGLYSKRVLPDSINFGSLIDTLSRCTSFGAPVEFDDTEDVSIEKGSSREYQIEYNAEEYMRYALVQSSSGIDMRIDHGRRCFTARIVGERDMTNRLVFSEDLDNLFGVTYAFSEEGCVNAIYGRTIDPGKDVEGTRPTFHINTELTGQRLIEKVVAVDAVVREEEVEIPAGDGYITKTVRRVDYSATLKVLQQECRAALADITESFTGEVLAGGYRRKFDIGDIVKITDQKRGIAYHKRIEEVQETVDSSGIKVTPTFGEPLKTIYDLIER